MEWSSLSNFAVLQKIGERVRDYRIRRKLTQEDLAKQAGVSVFSIQKVEKGRAVSLAIFIPVLRALRMLDNLESLMPEIGISPIELMKLKGEKVKRVRKKPAV